MHTKVFGRYNGPEEIMLETPNYTEINVIDNYAPTAKAIVTVTDADGQPVADAKVEFKIYNYAEFYTVATKYTDAEGKPARLPVKEICWFGHPATDNLVMPKSHLEKMMHCNSL